MNGQKDKYDYSVARYGDFPPRFEVLTLVMGNFLFTFEFHNILLEMWKFLLFF